MALSGSSFKTVVVVIQSAGLTWAMHSAAP
jgi:hypothetical protein